MKSRKGERARALSILKARSFWLPQYRFGVACSRRLCLRICLDHVEGGEQNGQRNLGSWPGSLATNLDIFFVWNLEIRTCWNRLNDTWWQRLSTMLFSTQARHSRFESSRSKCHISQYIGVDASLVLVSKERISIVLMANEKSTVEYLRGTVGHWHLEANFIWTSGFSKTRAITTNCCLSILLRLHL